MMKNKKMEMEELQLKLLRRNAEARHGEKLSRQISNKCLRLNLSECRESLKRNATQMYKPLV